MNVAAFHSNQSARLIDAIEFHQGHRMQVFDTRLINRYFAKGI